MTQCVRAHAAVTAPHERKVFGLSRLLRAIGALLPRFIMMHHLRTRFVHSLMMLAWALASLVPAYGRQPASAVDPKGPSADAASRWVLEEVKAEHLSFHLFDSAATRTKVSYQLSTPAAYEQQPDRRFPVVYWLHGSGGGASGSAPLVKCFDEAITSGKAPPFLVVFVNGLPEGMYVDWKDGSTPVESMIVRDLLPHIDATYRTIAARGGRMLDGFSMGGYGAARLGFKFPELFGAISIAGGGPLQEELVQAPRAGRQRAAELLATVYGGDQSYFRDVSPRHLAELQAGRLATDSLIRVVVGDRDETFDVNRRFHEHLERLRIPHEWKVLAGVPHKPMEVIRAMGDSNWAFHRAAFGGETRDKAAEPAVAATSRTATVPLESLLSAAMEEFANDGDRYATLHHRHFGVTQRAPAAEAASPWPEGEIGWEKIRFGFVPEAPTHTVDADGKHVGFEAELAEELVARINARYPKRHVELEWVVVDVKPSIGPSRNNAMFDALREGLRADRYDVAFSCVLPVSDPSVAYLRPTMTMFPGVLYTGRDDLDVSGIHDRASLIEFLVAHPGMTFMQGMNASVYESLAADVKKAGGEITMASEGTPHFRVADIMGLSKTRTGPMAKGTLLDVNPRTSVQPKAAFVLRR